MTNTIESEVKPLTKYESLVRLVEWLQDKPLLQENMGLYGIYCYADKDNWQEMLNEMGDFTKSSDDYQLSATHTIGSIHFKVQVGHEGICEKVIVGTKEVRTETYPDDVKPIVTTETVDVTKWVCPPSWKS